MSAVTKVAKNIVKVDIMMLWFSKQMKLQTCAQDITAYNQVAKKKKNYCCNNLFIY